MSIMNAGKIAGSITASVFTLALTTSLWGAGMESDEKNPIVLASSPCSKYERVLMTQLRDKTTMTDKFRDVANRLAELLVHRIVEYLPTKDVCIETPLEACRGEVLTGRFELVSIMRSGDALLDVFSRHFPSAIINKILVQRDEETAEPIFSYMKLSSTIVECDKLIITEPMIATGGTLGLVIGLLKEKGVQEDKIVIASICAAPEGLTYLKEQYPQVKIVTIVIDKCLNEKKFIVPGIGDFGNRYFGT